MIRRKAQHLTSRHIHRKNLSSLAAALQASILRIRVGPVRHVPVAEVSCVDVVDGAGDGQQQTTDLRVGQMVVLHHQLVQVTPKDMSRIQQHKSKDKVPKQTRIIPLRPGRKGPHEDIDRWTTRCPQLAHPAGPRTWTRMA